MKNLQTTALLLLAVLAGCGRSDEIVVEYGKVVGKRGGISVNGTSVLYGMFREKDFRTKRYRKISPGLKRYDTIIWFPDNYQSPSPEAVIALQDWLDDGMGRTLIYVGRDYDAEIDYYTHLLKTAEKGESEKLTRCLSEAQMRQDRRIRRFVGDGTTESCDWFKIERVPFREIKDVTGILASDTDQQSPNLSLTMVLQPSEEIVNDNHHTLTPLLTADDINFVYSMDSVHDAADVTAAYARLESGEQFGKVVVRWR